MNAFEQRAALTAEQAALRTELKELAVQHGARHSAHAAALNAVKGAQNAHGPNAGMLPALSAEAEAARVAMIEGDERQEAISLRLAEIEGELTKPLSLSASEIKAHLKALTATDERVKKLEDALARQRETVATMATVPDPRPDLADQRANLQADLLTGDRTQADLDKFDAETRKAVAAADAHAHALLEAQAVEDALEAKLGEAQAHREALAAGTLECRCAIVAGELETAIAAHTKAAQTEVEARNRANGLAALLRRANRTADMAAPGAGLEDLTAAQAEAQRLAAAGYSALF